MRHHLITRASLAPGAALRSHHFCCLCLYVLYASPPRCPWNACVYIAHQAPLSMGFSRQEYGVGSSSLLQGIFPAQGSNLGLLYCRRTLYHLSHQGSMYIYTHNNFIFCFYFPLAYLHAQSGRIWGESWAPGHEVFGRIICQFMTAADQSHV